jgi:hypothetical protein
MLVTYYNVFLNLISQKPHKHKYVHCTCSWIQQYHLTQILITGCENKNFNRTLVQYTPFEHGVYLM